MDSPPLLRRYNPHSITNHRRSNATKMMIIFASFLGFCIMSIHTRYLKTMVSSTNGVSKHTKRKKRGLEKVSTQGQDFVILYGTTSSGYDKVQSDFALWTQDFNFYPWTWALPEMSTEFYSKTEHFKPLMDSIVHSSSLVPESETFNIDERMRSTFFLMKFKDGFIEQWVQNKNIVMGSEIFSYVLNDKNGHRFLNTFMKTLPWNDPRFSLTKPGKVSAIILHRSTPVDHIKDLWISNMENDKKSKNTKFSTWMMNELNFDVLDSFGLASKLIKKGITVAFVDVDEVKNDLSHFISCSVLNLSCQDGLIVGLEHGQPAAKRTLSRTNIDVSTDKLHQLEETIRRYENDYRACFEQETKIKFYPIDKRPKEISSTTSNNSCPVSNQLIKEKIKEISSK